eukprot:61196-Pyramimonas_sp.AAC.1
MVVVVENRLIIFFAAMPPRRPPRSRPLACGAPPPGTPWWPSSRSPRCSRRAPLPTAHRGRAASFGRGPP